MFAALSLLAGSVPVIEYYRTGLVPHFPRAILAASLALCSLISLSIGIVLDTLNKYYRENFDGPYPATTLVGVSGLVDDRASVEIEGLAAQP